MTQYEAVIQTIENLGGIATLGLINQHVFEIKDCQWKSKNAQHTGHSAFLIRELGPAQQHN